MLAVRRMIASREHNRRVARLICLRPRIYLEQVLVSCPRDAPVFRFHGSRGQMLVAPAGIRINLDRLLRVLNRFVTLIV